MRVGMYDDGVRGPLRRLQAVLFSWTIAAVATGTGCDTQRAPVPPEPAPEPAPTPDAAPQRAPQPSGPSVLLQGGRVMTATGVIYERGDVLLQGDRIVAVGQGLGARAPQGTRVVDVTGKTVTPGIIDTHSHMGVYASPGFKAHSDGNEAVAPNTAYARAADGYWPQDPQIDHARAGGVTTAQILPGSANLIGGRSVTVRLIPWARSVEDARFPGAPEGLKMACGENPKRVYGGKGGPQTRMGNVAGYRNAFQKAVEYRRDWEKYQAATREFEERKRKQDAAEDTGGDGRDKDKDKVKEKDRPKPPARDFAMETMARAISGEILVHMHCYRADEMSLMLALSEEYGFKIRNFHHAVEAYKIADRLAAYGTGASVWADWWGFKAEAYDGVRENAAMISHAGARAIIHSDSAVGIQRLNQEAAKAMYAGRHAGFEVSEDEALRWITQNPAWSLGIDDQTGSLEPGKLADVVVWSGNPFSVYTLAERVYIGGALVYDRKNPRVQPRTDFEVGLRHGDITPAAGGAR